MIVFTDSDRYGSLTRYVGVPVYDEVEALSLIGWCHEQFGTNLGFEPGNRWFISMEKDGHGLPGLPHVWMIRAWFLDEADSSIFLEHLGYDD